MLRVQWVWPGRKPLHAAPNAGDPTLRGVLSLPWRLPREKVQPSPETSRGLARRGRGGVGEARTGRLCPPRSRGQARGWSHDRGDSPDDGQRGIWVTRGGDPGEAGDRGVSPRWCFLEDRKEPVPPSAGAHSLLAVQDSVHHFWGRDSVSFPESKPIALGLLKSPRGPGVKQEILRSHLQIETMREGARDRKES